MGHPYIWVTPTGSAMRSVSRLQIDQSSAHPLNVFAPPGTILNMQVKQSSLVNSSLPSGGMPKRQGPQLGASGYYLKEHAADWTCWRLTLTCYPW